MNPQPFLTYNANSPASGSFGTGWTESFQSKLVAGTSSGIVTITNAAGGLQRYSGAVSNQYLPPAGSATALPRRSRRGQGSLQTDCHMDRRRAAARASLQNDRERLQKP